MKKFLLIGILITYISANSQVIKAVTETREEVLLYNNNTWKYVNDSIVEEKEIKLNETKFIKDGKSSFLVKNNKIDMGVWINPKKWSFKKSKGNDATEYQFQLKYNDLYVMIISEKIEIPVESIKDIAVENAREVALDITVAKEEYRIVNGNKVIMLEMAGTMQGIKFS